MGQVVYQNDISFQFVQHTELNHLHKIKICDKLERTFWNQTTNHHNMD
jgi:hypothetical protein